MPVERLQVTFAAGQSAVSTADLSVGAGQTVRVRTMENTAIETQLRIANNGVTTYEPIPARSSWASGAVIDGDRVAIEVAGRPGDKVNLIVEVG